MSEHQVKQLQRSIAAAKEHIEQGKALERLRKNKDFQKIIQEGYLTSEAVRLVHLKGDDNMQSPEKQGHITKRIDAIGCLAGFLSTVSYLASNAERSLSDDEETLEHILKFPNEEE